MRIRILIWVCLLWAAGISGIAQKPMHTAAVGRIMGGIPDSMTGTTSGIAKYISTHFQTQPDRVRAAFIWIARSIRYDFDSMFSIGYDQDQAEISADVLRTRKGVCLHFADLFAEICRHCGVKMVVIQGYTKQGGRVDVLPHVWCAGNIDSTWYLFDPTWGSGYQNGQEYLRATDYSYFMANPARMIQSHMPFDPMWQLLEFPVTAYAFYHPTFRKPVNTVYFNFTDTIQRFMHETDLEKKRSMESRIARNGVLNSFIEAKLRVLRAEITYEQDTINANHYGDAVNRYNQAIRTLNEFVRLRNRPTLVAKDSLPMRMALDSAESGLDNATMSLQRIRFPATNILNAIAELGSAIQNTRQAIAEQQRFLNKFREIHDTKPAPDPGPDR